MDVNIPVTQLVALLPFVLAAVMYRELIRIRRRLAEMEESIMSLLFRSAIKQLDIAVVDLGEKDNEA